MFETVTVLLLGLRIAGEFLIGLLLVIWGGGALLNAQNVLHDLRRGGALERLMWRNYGSAWMVRLAAVAPLAFGVSMIVDAFRNVTGLRW